MSKIKNIVAREIKDSRGNPTVAVELETDKGTYTASCPAGKSTGAYEAVALPADQAIKNINEIIAPKLKGKNPADQKILDDLLIQLDGTENKSHLGANALLSVSLAVCRAGAGVTPLYQHIAKLAGTSDLKIPVPMLNILNGGAHADNDLDIQEFMVVPHKKTFSESLAVANTIFNRLTDLLKENFGSVPPLGDEGGYAPTISKTEQALFLLKNAISDESDVNISLDCAASEFYKDGKYIIEGNELSRQQLLDFYQDLVGRFAILSIEDPFAQDDWEGFKEATKQLGIPVIGDDLTTTNIKRIKEAESKKACNGVIIKLNQIGTVSETLEAVKLAQSFGWKIIVSHRSGETMDDFIADLAVGVGADFLKAGSPTQQERMVKYNRLMHIESELKKK